MSKKAHRLLENFVPEHYELALTTDRQRKIFTGSVTLSGHKKNRPSQRLTLHQRNLHITSAQVVRHDKKGDQSFTLSRINRHRSFNEVRLHTTEPLYPGYYTVIMQFRGPLTAATQSMLEQLQVAGTDNLDPAMYGESQLRTILPCIDEPAATAPFKLALSTPEPVGYNE